jgi:hypothetical protein
MIGFVNRPRALLLALVAPLVGVISLAAPPALAAGSGATLRARVAATFTASSAAASHAKLWQALGDDVNCGIAIHVPGKPATQVLCSGSGIPAPKKGVGFGDPGFVFLSAHGHPQLARLSQDTFEGTTPLRLASGSVWSALGVTCRISLKTVRCANRAGHGFTVAAHSYKAF